MSKLMSITDHKLIKKTQNTHREKVFDPARAAFITRQEKSASSIVSETDQLQFNNYSYFITYEVQK